MLSHLAAVFGLTLPPDVDDLAAQVADDLPPPLDPDELEHLLTQLDRSDVAANQAILTRVEPEALCPGCIRDMGLRWPAGATSRSCASHALELERQRVRRRGAGTGNLRCDETGPGRTADEGAGIA